MPIEWWPIITRAAIRENPHTLFVFGDNLIHAGYGGQAAAARGEWNTIGIPTKRLPSHTARAFFYDHDYDEAKLAIDKALEVVRTHLENGQRVVFPTAGVGTGRARLAKTAPKIWAYLQQQLEQLVWD